MFFSKLSIIWSIYALQEADNASRIIYITL